MNKEKIKKTISILLLIIWMSIIFYFSHQDATDSSSLSNGFISNIYSFITGKEATLEVLEKYSYIVRKLAHFGVYFILGLISFNVMYQFKVKYKYIFAFLIGFLYSVSDEIHQIFIPGRAGQIKDILIDSSGTLLAIFLCYLISLMVLKCKKTKNDDNL